jgi:threonine/homoserine/homoserine lactone efflux protein
MKIIAVLSILLVFFGSMYNLYAAEQYAQKNLKSIPKVVRYIAYGVGIFCSGYVIRILLWTLI